MATILIVDDEPDIRAYLATLLTNSGYCVLEASDGVEALQRVQTDRPDLAVADILMPTMDGFEFVRRLRNDPRNASTPVLFLTAAYHESEAQALAQACGVLRVLTKPCLPETILRSVAEALNAPPTGWPPVRSDTFASEHLHLLTNKVVAKIKELEGVNRRLTLLVDLSRQLALERDPLKLIESYGQEARSLLDARCAAICLLKEGGRQFDMFFISGTDEELAGKVPPPPASLGLAGRVLTERRPLRVRDVGSDPGGAIFVPPHPCQGPFLGVAIGSSRQQYGLLYFIGKPGAEEFSEQDEAMAVALAAQVGVAYRSAQQFQQIKTQLGQLEASRNLLQAVIEGIPEAVYVKDLQGRYLLINSPGACLVGKTAEEVLGRDDSALFASESARRFMEADRRVMESGETQTYEDTGTAAGVTRTYLTTKAPFRGPHGEALGVLGISRDITESKMLQTERDRLLEYLRLQIDRLPLAYILLDADLRILDWNPAAEKMFGYTREEVLGRVALDLILPLPISAHVQEIVRRISAGDMHAHSVNDNRTKDGRIITCEWFNTPLLDSDGRLSGVISLAQDITERKRSEAMIQQLAAIVESSDDAILSMTLDGLIVSWNRGAESMYGCTAEEVKGQSISLLVPPGHSDEVPHILAELREGRTIKHYETIRKTKEGKLIDVCLTISPIRDREGRITGISGIARDITEQKRSRETLWQAERKYRALVEQIPAIVYTALLDEAGSTIYVSPQIEAILGFTRAEWTAKPSFWLERTHPDDRERVLAAMRGLREPEGRFSAEFRILARDGREVWIRDSGRVVCNDSGQPTLTQGIAIDITDLKQAEEKLHEYNVRLQSLSRRLVEVQEAERRHLALELHDEIGQSLTGLQFVLEAGPELSAEEARAKLHDARTAVSGLLAKVRELSFDLRPAVLDHLGLLPALLWLFERYTAQTKVRVQFRHDGLNTRFAPTIETAAYRLVQEALTNVARHAGVKEVSVRVWVQEGALHLQIEDEGAGFDPEAALVSSATAGLAGMRERVQLLGGQLAINSAPGEGTQLLARLPLGS